MQRLFVFVIGLFALCFAHQALAQTLTADNVQIVWKVTNRFSFFREPGLFGQQEKAFHDYANRVAPRSGNPDDSGNLLSSTSVLGTEHVLNDRRMPFTDVLRPHFDWRGWAAKAVEDTCYDQQARTHSACGGVEAYVNPKAHEIEIGLKALTKDGPPMSEYVCHWHVGSNPDQPAPCDQAITATIGYPGGETISVNVDGESPVSLDVKVRDFLILGLGDSFASGEGNPDLPVQLDENQRVQNLYPTRAVAGALGSAHWLDRLCHRSLYSYQLRAALQVAIENPHAAVTYLGYACSGATVEKGLIGPQSYVEYRSIEQGSGDPVVQPIPGGKADSQFALALRDLCKVAPVQEQGLWKCPGNQFRRSIDYVFLSIGGNDIGFSSLVSWATLRTGTLTKLAGWLGVTESPDQFRANRQNTLPKVYQHLARQLQLAIPLPNGDLAFDPSHVILTAYPDILADEKGKICAGIQNEGQPEDAYPANQSMDRFSNWLVASQNKMEAAHAELEGLYAQMRDLAEANGWSFAGRAHTGKPFLGHGFCAQRKDRLDDPAEVLMVPCWGKAARATQSCQSGIFGQGTGWRPFDPASQNFPYALRQRWVRTINDAYMIIDQKIVDRSGTIDEASSLRDFSETTGAMHPTAEGEAALADAMLMDLRIEIAKQLDDGK